MADISDFRSGPFGQFKTSTDTSNTYIAGQRFRTTDGRELALVFTATGLNAGQFVSSAAPVANHQGLTVTAVTTTANGQTQVTATLGATAVTAGQYAGGYLSVKSSTGAGQTLRIASHPAANASASVVITLEDTPVTALTTSSVVNLFPNPYVNVVNSPTTGTSQGQVLGVSIATVAANSYCFVVARGPVAVLADASAPSAGVDISVSTATSGAFMQATNSTTAHTSISAGYTLQASTSGSYSMCYIEV